jgi:hypothetical protein
MNPQPETHVLLAARSDQKWPAQASERRPLPRGGAAPSLTPGLAHLTGRRTGSAAWTNALALVAVAIAIALLVVKNLDRNSSNRLQRGSAFLKISAQPTANP